MHPLSDLAAALAAATGPSPDLDAEISTRLFGLTMWKPTNCGWFVSSRSHPLPCEPPRYTASLDAITGALEQRWPGVVRTTVQQGIPETMRSVGINEPNAYWWRSQSAPLCLCLAAVRLALAEEGR